MSERSLRHELKLLCPGPQLPQVRLWMRLHPAGFRVEHPPRWVNSIYFDDCRLGCLSDNLEGLAIRNKLRFRWYGEYSPVVRPNLELKHKNNLLGTKEQFTPGCDLDLTQPWQAILTGMYACLPLLWRTRLQAASQPVLLNRYWREYYVTPDGAVRVTLDSMQVAYDQRFASRPNLRAPLRIEEILVIEIKADQSHTDRVQPIANAFPLPRTRNSKYAKGMLAALYSQ